MLDNLAWAIHHQYGIPAGVYESKKAGLTKIGLFKKAFMEGLRAVSPEFANMLEPYSGWHQIIKKLRDPIAHRIPIYAVPALLDNQEARQYQAKFVEFAGGIGRRTEDESDKLLDEIRHIG